MHFSRSRIWKSASQCYLKCLWTARLSIDWFVQLGTVFVSPTFVERFFKMKSFWRGCGCHQRGWTTPWIRYQPPPTVLRVTYARPTPTLHCCEFQFEKYRTSHLLFLHCASTLETGTDALLAQLTKVRLLFTVPKPSEAHFSPSSRGRIKEEGKKGLEDKGQARVTRLERVCSA